MCYTLLTTFPQVRCGNIGDKLIEVAIKKIILSVKKDAQFITFFREDDMTANLDVINKTKAIIMPGFPIRDLPMYPGVYKLVDDLRKIRVPMIPIGANWNVYPGDYFDRRNTVYSKKTVDFLKYVSSQVKAISCREYHVCRILKKHEINNTIMTGDPAWFDPDFLYKKMKRPTRIEKLVFTPPLSAFYEEQAKSIIDMLAKLFPASKKFCCFHLADSITRALKDGQKSDNSVAMNMDVAYKNERIRNFAKDRGFINVLASHDISKIDFYEECDLHVGYECHAHWGFIRKRIPSVLIAEDARGVGFIYTQGVTGFEGFKRCIFEENVEMPLNTSGYCDSIGAYTRAVMDPTVADRIREFIEDELESNFRKYAGLADYLDEIYDTRMKPFIEDVI